jgi:hypothetical protein
VPPETAREDAGGFDRRRGAEIVSDQEGTDRNSPPPAFAARVVLRIADKLDDGEDRLPPGGVADRQVTSLQARAPRGRVRAQRAGVDVRREGTVACAANEKPVLHDAPRFLTVHDYPRLIRAALVIVLLTTAVAGCGSSDGERQPAAEPPPSTTTTTTETTDGIDPLEGAGTEPVEADPTSDETALLERVAVGRHEGFDRVVFQFRNVVPGYRVEYVQPPLKEDGSGNVVPVRGDSFVSVRMEPASGFDLTTGEGELVYKGPRRLSGATAGTSVVREVVRTGDFEAVLSWAIGLEQKVEFKVQTTKSPARLIIDFRNH